MRANLRGARIVRSLVSGWIPVMLAVVLAGVGEGCSEYGVSSLDSVDPELPADAVPSEPPPEDPAPSEPPAERAPEPAEPGDLVFSELMINPEVVDDAHGEWVELYNTAGHPVDVSGYAFHDLDYDSWELTGPFVVPAHGYFVMCAETELSLNGGVPCDGWFQRVSLGGGLALANSPDEVVLTRPDGVEIDRLEYDETWFTNGVAMGVDPLELDADGNDDPAAWCDQATVVALGGEPGTPGESNDPCW